MKKFTVSELTVISEQILKRKHDDDKVQSVVDKFFKEIFPNCYSPILDGMQLFGFIECLKILNPDLAEWCEYYAYEACGMESATVSDTEKREYNFSKEGEFLRFLINNFQ